MGHENNTFGSPRPALVGYMESTRDTITDQLYRDIFMTAPFGIYTLDKDGVITSFNPKMAELSGNEEESAIGINALELDTYKKVGLDEFFRQGIAGKPFETEVTYESHFAKKVSIRYYRGIPISDRDIKGQARLLLIVEDITDRKRIETELKAAAQFSEENTNPVLRVDGTGHILLTNVAAKDMAYGWGGGEAMGDLPVVLVEAVKESLASSRTQSVDVPDQGKVVLFEVIPQKEGGYANVYGRDISEERKLQQLKDHFLSVASHQLRTPMTVISGYIDLMLKGHAGPITEVQRDYLQKIINNTKHLLEFIDATIDINRLESGAMNLKVTTQPIDLPVRRAVDNIKSLYDQAGLNLSCDVKPDMVEIESGQLERVITNLLSNSLKFTESGGQVTVASVDSQPGEVVIAVTDTGIGISEEEQKLLFQKYAQIGSEWTNKMQGTGLGLTINRDLVEKMKGRMWVESELGKGATFYVALPRAVPNKVS